MRTSEVSLTIREKDMHENATANMDRELEEKIRNFLDGRNYPALRQLDIEVEAGKAIVSGIVPTFHEKQVATSCCQRVAGVFEVINNIKVDESPVTRDLRFVKKSR